MEQTFRGHLGVSVQTDHGIDNRMTAKRGIIGSMTERREDRPRPKQPSYRNRAGLFIVLGALAIIAIAFVPLSGSQAKPDYENIICSNCHSTSADFITVTGLPASQYSPGEVYRITVTVSDPDGASTNENSFDFRLSSGGGTLTLGSPADPNVEINSALEASANDGVAPMRAHTWNFTWTAPTSGSVTVDVWAVVGGFGGSTNTGTKAPYDHNTYALGSTAIPEFPTFVVPVLGMVGAVIIISRATKKKS